MTGPFERQPLEAVRAAAGDRDQAQRQLEAVLRRAYAQRPGPSLRALAEAAGMSHEAVRRIVSPA